jgi:hypothetical protein
MLGSAFWADLAAVSRPTTGFDPEARLLVDDRRSARRGTTILTTHYLDRPGARRSLASSITETHRPTPAGLADRHALRASYQC